MTHLHQSDSVGSPLEKWLRRHILIWGQIMWLVGLVTGLLWGWMS